MTRTTTRTTRTTGRTPAQRAAERQALLTTMGDKIAALSNSAEWLAYLDAVAMFRRYSFNNLMLIAAQCPHATRVAGFRTWQQLGRHVRKGEKAIKILGYSTKKVTTTDPATGNDVEDRVTRFPVLSVFDISQTDGDPVPTHPYTLPDGIGPAGTLERLERLSGWLQAEGWTVTERDLPATLEGYTDHDRHLVVTKTTLSPAARLLVLLHESAHAVLHEDTAHYNAHRGLCETEAESAAYVLATLLGVDADASSISYVAGWSASDPAVLAAAASHVLQAVNTIAAALGLDDEDTDNSNDASSNDDSTDQNAGEPDAAATVGERCHDVG